MTSPEQHRRLGDARNSIGRLLAAYADARPSSTGLPRREDVGFERLKPLLGWEFLAEWVAPASIVVRLSGAHIDYVLGRNVTGQNFFDHYRPEQRTVYARFFGAIADHSCGGYSVRRVIVNGAEAFDYHSIYLPLAPRPDYVPIVGAVAVTGFERVAHGASSDAAPDFQALSRLGVFDIGHGVPDGALAGLEPIDIGTVVATIDEAGDLALDKLAYDTRSSVGRPRTAG
ncbi:MAG TPA: PAS domain-containing protein [Candidatus Sulfotelmatobacter sp.]|nr:PAS domain-containing protein [Candidatus Sulfotelmatobacter sp.]